MAKIQQARKRKLGTMRARLAEAEGTLQAIRCGDVDAIMVDGPQGSRVFTLQSPDDPYRVLVERMNEGAATLTSQGTILFCNRRLAEMVGRSAERLVGCPFKSILNEKQRPGFTELARQALDKDVRDTSSLLRDDGTELPVQLSFSPLADEQGGQNVCVIATDLSDQKQAEMRLREQAALLDLVPDAVVVRDVGNRITFWSHGAETIYRWSSSEALGKDSTELLKTEFFEPTERVQAELMGQSHWEGDAIQYSRDGARMIVSSRSVIQRDAQGEPIRILTINNDVTAHRDAEEAVREGEERFRDMANNISQLAWMADEHGSISWYNQRWFDYSGTTLEEMAGWGWQKIHHPGHVDRVMKKIRRCFQTGEIWEDTFPLRGQDGSYRSFLSRAVPIRDAEGKVLRWFGTHTDITDRQQDELRLHSLAERLSLAAAVAKVGVWDWDLTTNVGTWDTTMLEMYGFPPDYSMSYEKWAAAVCPEDRPQAESALRKVIDENNRGDFEFRIVRQDGSLRNITAACRAFSDDSDNVIRVIGVNVDITERRDVENALEKSRMDQLRFKDELLSHVSHELRTPLTAIKQFSTILLNGAAGELSQDQRKYQEIVLKNILQLQSMIDDLLEVTRLDNGKLAIQLESVSVSEVMTDAINTVHESALTKGVTLSCDLSPGLPATYADPTRLRQILLILIDNALRFTPAGGEIRIRARPGEQDANSVLFEVCDTGCGIPSDEVKRIFERLYQARHTRSSRMGLGLGLFICQELVTRQGGQIRVESELNKGSTFSFTLPIFCVSTLIAPLLVNHEWPAKAVALVVVEVRSQEATLSKQADEYWSREAYCRIRSCLSPNLEVLLRQTEYDGEGQRFFLAALVGDNGVSELTRKIREELGSTSILNKARHSISYTLLRPIHPSPETSMEETVSNMAACLEKAIHFQILSGGKHL